MKHILLLAIFLLGFQAVFCANAEDAADSAVLSVTYKATFKVRVEDKDIYKDEQILRIGKHSSEYYSTKQRRYEHLRDSLRKAPNSKEKYYSMCVTMYADNPGSTHSVYKNYPEEGILTYTDNFLSALFYYYEEPMPNIEWNLVEGDTTIIGYPCKKAVGRLHGRTWTAWYSTDLPYDNGPWKLGGLPGLIMSASESEGIFSYACTGIMEEQTGKPLAFFKKKRYQKCTAAQFQQYMVDYWKDQSNFLNKAFGKPSIDLGGAQKVFKPCLMEYYK